MDTKQLFDNYVAVLMEIFKNGICVIIDELCYYGNKYSIREHIFKPSNNKDYFPWTYDIIYGGGFGGSPLAHEECAKKVLKIINRNHFISIDLLKEHLDKKQSINIHFFESNVLPKLNNLMVFIDGTMEDNIEYNDMLNKNNEANNKIIQELLFDLDKKIKEKHEYSIKNSEYFDDKMYDKCFDLGLEFHILDITNMIKNDDDEDLTKIINDPKQREIFNNLLFDKNYSPDNYKNHKIGREDLNALIISAYHNSYKCMKLLLDNGANPDYQNDGGSTALHIAGRYGYDKCVMLLLNAGCNVTLMENDNKTAYHRCVINKQLICANMIKNFKSI